MKSSHIVHKFSRVYDIFFCSEYDTIMGGNCFAFVCVCVCVCNALRQNQEVVCAEKNTSILYKLPNLILDCLHLEDGDSKILGNVDSYSHIDKLQSVSQKSCIFTKAVVTSNLVTVTYLQISNLYQRHAKIKIISWTSYLLHS